MPADPRSRLLSLAADLLAHATGRPSDVFTVEIRTSDGSCVLTFTTRPGEFSPPTEHKLTELHRRVLAAATADPVSAKTLARLADCSYSPRFREVVAELTRWGLLRRTPDGLNLPEARQE